MALISATTAYKTDPGRTYVVGITDYNGHTTTLEYYSPDAAAWVFIAGTSATDDFGGSYTAVSRDMRITISGGTGSIDVLLTPKKP